MKGHMGAIHFTFLPVVRMHLPGSDPVHFTGPPKSLIPQQFYHEPENTPRVMHVLRVSFIYRHNVMCKLPAKCDAQSWGESDSGAVAYELTIRPFN
jgi:hypothetical protein